MTRWGIAGTGRMAATFCADLHLVPDAELAAVGSRSLDKAASFAAENGAPAAKAYGSYAELAASDDVDVIYIATPHPQHKAIALDAIAHGKAILVEKAFTATYAGAQEVVQAARDKGVFCMEGMWTRFVPVVRELRRIIADGEIGTVTLVQGDLLAHRDYDPTDRLFAPELGGGAVLDLGVYVESFAQMILGAPSEVLARGQLYPNGVESSVTLLQAYESGAMASLAGSLQAYGPGQIVVAGDAGWIQVHPRFHHPSTITVHQPGKDARDITLQPTGKGYTHEIEEVQRCLAAGLTESPEMTLDDTLAVMKALQEALDQIGVRTRDDD